MSSSPGVHVMIISWVGQHQNAALIARTVSGYAEHVTIVFSDPNPGFEIDIDCERIKRPNHLFFGDKFKACLDHCQSDLMLMIHADCTCDDWVDLIRKCRNAHAQDLNIGIWSPSVSYTSFDLKITEVATINGTSLSAVVFVDAIVWCISPSVIRRMGKVSYEDNIYGWGISPLACAYTLTHNMMVVVDQSIAVSHPRDSGYSTVDAKNSSKDFRSQFTMMELIQEKQRAAYMKMRSRSISIKQ